MIAGRLLLQRYLTAALLWTGLWQVAIGANQGADQRPEMVADDGWSQIAAVLDNRLSESLKAIARRDITSIRDHAALAQSCLALVAAEERLATDMYRSALVKLADALVREKDLNGDGRIGWGVPTDRERHRDCPEEGMLDAFGDGSCNPQNTDYAFQTGLAVMCLARAYLSTGEASFRQVAVEALDSSWGVGATPAACPKCFYYWYSYHQNDRNRYVRNTNALMGAAAAWVWKVTGIEKYRKRALSVAAAEHRELTADNMGYFGIDDPKYRDNPARESRRIENHVPWVAKSLHDIGMLLKNGQIIEDGLRVQDSWQFCDNQRTCQKGCEIWAADPKYCTKSVTLSPCFFKNETSNYSRLCGVAVSHIYSVTLSSYQLWALMDY